MKFNKIVNYLIININVKTKKSRLLKLKCRYIPSFVTGLNIKLAGRISNVRKKVRVKSNEIPRHFGASKASTLGNSPIR